MALLKRIGLPALAGAALIVSTFAAPAAAESQDVDIAAGEKLYMQVCAACHGPKGGGVQGAGKPFDDDLSTNTIVNTALEGGERMPAFKGAYSEQEFRNIAAYIRQRLLDIEE